MNILITAATDQEISPVKILIERFKDVLEEKGLKFHFLVIGVGLHSSIFKLLDYLHQFRVDHCINLGIAGSFKKEIKIGEVCYIVSDQFGDFGAEDDGGNFMDIFELGLVDEDAFPFNKKVLTNKYNFHDNTIRKVSSSTVQKVLGEANQIQKFINKYPDVDIENMESGAIFYVCIQKNIPFQCFRSISNYVEPRNRQNWRIDLAVENLTSYLGHYLDYWIKQL